MTSVPPQNQANLAASVRARLLNVAKAQGVGCGRDQSQGRATVDQILTVEHPTEDHLYWPKLDIDLSVESLRNPVAFPLVASLGQ